MKKTSYDIYISISESISESYISNMNSEKNMFFYIYSSVSKIVRNDALLVALKISHPDRMCKIVSENWGILRGVLKRLIQSPRYFRLSIGIAQSYQDLYDYQITNLFSCLILPLFQLLRRFLPTESFHVAFLIQLNSEKRIPKLLQLSKCRSDIPLQLSIAS